MSDPDRTDAFDQNRDQTASMFGPDGGSAIWVRREEMQPRASVRGSTHDIIQIVTELACLQVGLERLIEVQAKANGLDPMHLHEMVEHAAEVVRTKMDYAARIQKAGGS